jgi:hypothetical protein
VQKLQKITFKIDKTPFHNTLSIPSFAPCLTPQIAKNQAIYGAYISYALTVALSVATCLAWWVLIGFSLQDSRFFQWMGVNMILLIAAQPYLMRLSRAIWLSIFVKYNPNWRTEKPEEPERTGSKAPAS